LPVFVQRDLPGSAVGGGIPIRRSSVEIISSCSHFLRLTSESLHNTTWSTQKNSRPLCCSQYKCRQSTKTDENWQNVDIHNR